MHFARGYSTPIQHELNHSESFYVYAPSHLRSASRSFSVSGTVSSIWSRMSTQTPDIEASWSKDTGRWWSRELLPEILLFHHSQSKPSTCCPDSKHLRNEMPCLMEAERIQLYCNWLETDGTSSIWRAEKWQCNQSIRQQPRHWQQQPHQCQKQQHNTASDKKKQITNNNNLQQHYHP